MGVLSAVIGAFSSKELISLDEPPAAGDALTVMGALIVELRKLRVDEIRKATRASLEVVIRSDRLDDYADLLTETLGEPCKPFGVRAKFTRALSIGIDAMGGIQRSQCLFLRKFQDDRVAFAAF